MDGPSKTLFRGLGPELGGPGLQHGSSNIHSAPTLPTPQPPQPQHQRGGGGGCHGLRGSTLQNYPPLPPPPSSSSSSSIPPSSRLLRPSPHHPPRPPHPPLPLETPQPSTSSKTNSSSPGSNSTSGIRSNTTSSCLTSSSSPSSSLATTTSSSSSSSSSQGKLLQFSPSYSGIPSAKCNNSNLPQTDVQGRSFYHHHHRPQSQQKPLQQHGPLFAAASLGSIGGHQPPRDTRARLMKSPALGRASSLSSSTATTPGNNLPSQRVVNFVARSGAGGVPAALTGHYPSNVSTSSTQIPNFFATPTTTLTATTTTTTCPNGIIPKDYSVNKKPLSTVTTTTTTTSRDPITSGETSGDVDSSSRSPSPTWPPGELLEPSLQPAVDDSTTMVSSTIPTSTASASSDRRSRSASAQINNNNNNNGNVLNDNLYLSPNLHPHSQQHQCQTLPMTSPHPPHLSIDHNEASFNLFLPRQKSSNNSLLSSSTRCCAVCGPGTEAATAAGGSRVAAAAAEVFSSSSSRSAAAEASSTSAAAAAVASSTLAGNKAASNAKPSFGSSGGSSSSSNLTCTNRGSKGNFRSGGGDGSKIVPGHQGRKTFSIGGDDGAAAPSSSSTKPSVTPLSNDDENARSSSSSASTGSLETLADDDDEMHFRPTWCDAELVYREIERGRAAGNVKSLWLRSKIQEKFCSLGLRIYQHAGKYIFLGLLILSLACVGLKTAKLETNVEKLWVKTDGELERELKYLQNQLGERSSGNINMEILIQTGSGKSRRYGTNQLTQEALLVHLDAAMAAINTEVFVDDVKFTIEDICYKPNFPDFDNPMVATFTEKFLPCAIITPLDCFWEGSKLLGPKNPLTVPFQPNKLVWTTLNPSILLDNIAINYDVAAFKDIFTRAGISSGYQEKPCLNPQDPQCPRTAPNKKSSRIPDVGSELSGGCYGYASKYMHWKEPLIMGGIKKNRTHYIQQAEALQTVIQLMGEDEMYDYHKATKKVSSVNPWSVDKARDVLRYWQRNYTQNVLVAVNTSKHHKIHTFTTTSFEDILQDFSQISILRVAVGFVLILVYACVSMLRWKDGIHSQCSIAVAGILLVALSIASALGLCSVLGSVFNAATTQILPFLSLGLGVDDMFLLASTYLTLSKSKTTLPYETWVGEILKRCGISVALKSLSSATAFFIAAIIPIPALRAFCFQAAISILFNAGTMLFVFPAIISVDIRRKRENKYDLICCLGPKTNKNVSFDLCQTTYKCRENKNKNDNKKMKSKSIVGPSQSVAFGTAQHDCGQFCSPLLPCHSFQHPIMCPTHLQQQHLQQQQQPQQLIGGICGHQAHKSDENGKHLLALPDPFEWNSAKNEDLSKALVQYKENQGHAASAENPTTPFCAEHRDSNSSCPACPPPCSFAWHQQHSGCHQCAPAPCTSANSHAKMCCKYSENQVEFQDCDCKFSLAWFARWYGGKVLKKTQSKVVIVTAFIGLLTAAFLGCSKVKDGLDLSDIVPRDTEQFKFLTVQSKYFGFYNMYLITKNFDYPKNQKLLYKYHESFQKVKHIMKNDDGGLPSFWLPMMRDWLKGLQDAFDRDKVLGRISSDGWFEGASQDAILAYKLLQQTGEPDDPINKDQVEHTRLVSNGDIINPKAFYNYLSAWVTNDALAYSHSMANLHPPPEQWSSIIDRADYEVPKSRPLAYTQIPFFLVNLNNTEDITTTIQEIRDICKDFEVDLGLPNFPIGIPFTFWQQYIHLRWYLFLAIAAVLAATFLILCSVLLNPWVSVIVVVVLGMLVIELFGLMGFLGIKLSAIPAVILIVSVGLGVEFSLHISIAFLTTIGTKDRRLRLSLEQTMSPVVHGAVSTLLGVVMLAFSEFDFIFRYFFFSLSALILLGLLNGIVLLPVLLAWIGPAAEVTPREDPHRFSPPEPTPEPSPEPSPVLVRPRLVLPPRSSRSKFPSRVPSEISLSTITEEPSQYSSSSSHYSSHEIIVEPEVIVETTTGDGCNGGAGCGATGAAGRPGTPGSSSGSSSSSSSCPSSVGSHSSSSNGGSKVTTRVKATAKVKVEVHTPTHVFQQPSTLGCGSTGPRNAGGEDSAKSFKTKRKRDHKTTSSGRNGGGNAVSDVRLCSAPGDLVVGGTTTVLAAPPCNNGGNNSDDNSTISVQDLKTSVDGQQQQHEQQPHLTPYIHSCSCSENNGKD